MKKTLSLVLALAMVFSLLGVASADYKDQADVKYTEAVNVMTGIGAIDGYADGTVNPAGSITREEAAKMVTYAILGKNVAEMLPAGNTGFTDVPAARWSSAFISYCVNKGIINGMGDGTFAPTEKVTGYQLAKMMLVAAGYGKNDEFVGASWALNAAVLGNKLSVFKGTKSADLNKPATREEAMLYAFNGLFVELMSWSKDKEAYVQVDGDSDEANNFALSVYDLKPSTTRNADDYGRPATVWTASKVSARPIAAANSAPAYTFDGGKISDVLAKLTRDDIDYSLTKNENGTKLYANGNECWLADFASDEFGKGVAVEVYLNATKTAVSRFVLVYTYAGVVTKVVADNTKTAADETALYVTVYGGTKTVENIKIEKTDKVPGFDVVYAAAKKGSYVLVDPKNDNLDSNAFNNIAIAKSVTGKLTGYITGKYVKIDGTMYPVANNYAQAVATSVGTIYDFVLDADGNVLAAKNVGDIIANIDGVVYVVDAEYTTTTAYGRTVYNVLTVALDGTAKVYQTTADPNVTTGFYKLGTSTAGTTFTAVTGIYGTDKVVGTTISGDQTVTPRTVSINVGGGKAYLANSTTYLFIDNSGVEPKVTVKSGAITTALANGAKAIVTRTATGAYELAAVVAGSSYNEVSDNVLYVPANKEDGTVGSVGSEAGVPLYGAVNALTGEKVAFPCEAKPTANTFYTYTVSEKGVYTLSNIADVTSSASANAAGAYTVTGDITAYSTRISANGETAPNLVDIQAGAAKVIDLRDGAYDVDTLTEVLALEADDANFRIVVSVKDGVPFVASIIVLPQA